MLLKIDFGALGQVREHWRGIGVTLFINWAVKPFSMALLGWIFIGHLFAPWLPAGSDPVLYRRPHSAGRGALHGDGVRVVEPVRRRAALHPEPGRAQRRHHDLRLRADGRPAAGVASITVPWETLLISVVLYIVVPGHHRAAMATRAAASGPAALTRTLHALQPVSLVALLTTLVLLFGFQGEQIIAQPLVIVLLAVPILIQVYLQCRAGLLAEPPLRRRMVRRCAGGADRRQQLLRTRRRRGDQPVRLQLRRGTGDGGRRAGRGAGDALGGLSGEGVAWLVRGRRRHIRHHQGAGGNLSVTKSGHSAQAAANRRATALAILDVFHSVAIARHNGVWNSRPACA